MVAIHPSGTIRPKYGGILRSIGVPTPKEAGDYTIDSQFYREDDDAIRESGIADLVINFIKDPDNFYAPNRIHYPLKHSDLPADFTYRVGAVMKDNYLDSYLVIVQIFNKLATTTLDVSEIDPDFHFQVAVDKFSGQIKGVVFVKDNEFYPIETKRGVYDKFRLNEKQLKLLKSICVERLV